MIVDEVDMLGFPDGHGGRAALFLQRERRRQDTEEV